MIFKIFTLLIMILFYSIYFGKMLFKKDTELKLDNLEKGKIKMLEL